MANEQNLIPFTSEQNREEAKRNGKKGGVASGAARRAKREARETARQVLSFTPELPEQVLETMRKMGMRKKAKPDMRFVATLAIMQKAMKGDVKCYEFICNMAGETAEAALSQIKADEAIQRSQYSDEQNSAELDMDSIRRKMDEMTDEELAAYQKLCEMFAPMSVEEGKQL